MILSVSRRTDIPNYYSEWFLERIKEGFLYVRNPINIHQVSKINLTPDVIDCIVFWTKNPTNMIERLEELKDYQYYFQFTLTGYGKDIEPNLPNKRNELISVFKTLSNKIGKDRVIWRYDPIFITEKYTMEYHVKAFTEIIDCLANYTEKCVISFIDLYVKTQRNTKEYNINSMKEKDIFQLASKFVEIAQKYNITIETCAEEIDLTSIGIEHGSCIDKKVIEKILGCKVKGSKDKNQRQECGCFESIEIGAYNTCLNGCKYCYANFNDDLVHRNLNLYDKHSPFLCSKLDEKDKVTERKMVSLKEMQLDLFDFIS